jgi:formylglycine-generating enzyme required for sulfatase activity
LEFVRVPAGSFDMGSSDSDANPLDAEGPVRELELEGFEISSTPVTNAQFAAFANETGYTTEAEKAGWSFVFHLLVPEAAEVLGISESAWWWHGITGASWRNPTGGTETHLDLANHPAVHISYTDALAYCQWGDFFLPNEAQWEKAARGTDGREYPWGDTWDPSKCRNSSNRGNETTAPVDAYPEGAGPYGHLNMAGNVWEWCQDAYEAQA